MKGQQCESQDNLHFLSPSNISFTIRWSVSSCEFVLRVLHGNDFSMQIALPSYFFILQPSDMPAKKRRRSRGITVSKPDTEMEYAKEQRGTEFPLSYRQLFSSSSLCIFCSVARCWDTSKKDLGRNIQRKPAGGRKIFSILALKAASITIAEKAENALGEKG